MQAERAALWIQGLQEQRPCGDSWQVYPAKDRDLCGYTKQVKREAVGNEAIVIFHYRCGLGHFLSNFLIFPFILQFSFLAYMHPKLPT